MDSSDWSNGIQYHIFDTRPDTEFKPDHTLRVRPCPLAPPPTTPMSPTPTAVPRVGRCRKNPG